MEKNEILSLLSEMIEDNKENKGMEKILGLMTIMNSTPNTNVFVKDEDKTILNGIKACLPYLDKKRQKNFNLFIKIMEIQTIIEQYKASDTNLRNSDENWRSGMLLAAKPYLSEYNSQKIDSLIKILTLKELF